MSQALPQETAATPATQDMAISVISPVFNRKDEVRQALDTVIAAMRAHPSVELILVDNGSTDGTYEMLLERYRGAAQVHQLKDATIAGLRNFGAQRARGRILSFLDSDCLVPEDYFHRIERVMEQHRADATGAMVAVRPDAHWIEDTWDRLNSRRHDGFCHLIGSANFAVRKAVFERIGGFDPKLQTGEDAEICMKLIQGGFKIYQSQTIEAIHLRNTARLKDFYDKQVWYGLGMFGTFSPQSWDKPVLTTLVHLGLNLVGFLGLFLPVRTLSIRLLFFAVCITGMPALAVMYRYLEQGVLLRPLRSLLLYELYFYGRVWALFKIIAGASRPTGHHANE